MNDAARGTAFQEKIARFAMSDAATIVIGGGLAGSALGIELAGRGGHVIILERTAAAHHKVCGEFLSAEAQGLLARLGLDVWRLGASPVTHLSLEFDGHLARMPLPFRGAGLSRYRLDQALLEAAARAGAEIRRGISVTHLDFNRRIMVHTPNEHLAAAQVALATGKHNLRGLPRPKTMNIAFKMQLRLRGDAIETLDQLVHLSMFRGGYAGVCLVEDGIATICWVVERVALDGEMPSFWKAHADFLCRRSVFFSKLLNGATALWEKPVAVAAIPYGFLRQETVSDAIYPIGDQLVVIPSYTGDGTSIALHSGITAAEAILDRRPATDFQAAAIAKLKPQIAWAKLANIAFVNTTAQRMTAAIARLAPWALTQVATLIANKTRVRL
jgi:flavin-dependent dehydrogenase